MDGIFLLQFMRLCIKTKYFSPQGKKNRKRKGGGGQKIPQRLQVFKGELGVLISSFGRARGRRKSLLGTLWLISTKITHPLRTDWVTAESISFGGV